VIVLKKYTTVLPLLLVVWVLLLEPALAGNEGASRPIRHTLPIETILRLDNSTLILAKEVQLMGEQQKKELIHLEASITVERKSLLKLVKTDFVTDLTPIEILAMPIGAETHVLAQAQAELLVEGTRQLTNGESLSRLLLENGPNEFPGLLDLELYDYIGYLNEVRGD